MAEAAAVQGGIDGEVYRNSGSFGSPTWAAIGLVRNVSTGMPWNMSDASIRATAAVLEHKTQVKIGGSIEVRADPADAGYQAMFDASRGRTPMDLMIIDGPVTQEGVKGVRGYMNLNFEQDQPIDGVIYTRFTFSPAYHSDGYPAYVELGASSTPTFTQF